jgi:8-oxo-dGTP diphosphatase
MQAIIPADAIHVVAAVIRESNGAVLLTRRADDAHQGGLWEFPGGKVEPGELRLAALRRELKEELAIEVQQARPLIAVMHDYGDRKVWLDVWCVDRWSGDLRGREGQPLQWVLANDLDKVAMPAADLPIVKAAQLPSYYLVTPEPKNKAQFIEIVRQQIRSGCPLLQLRAKSLATCEFRELAINVLEISCGTATRVLLNRDPSLAMELNADGVHLTSQALWQLSTRPVPGSKMLGVSCHNREDLEQARRIGADFAVLGPVGETASHAGLQPMGWSRFAEFVRAINLPVYAIGGMQRSDLATSQEHGAQGIAAIRDFWLNLPDSRNS